MKKKEKDNKKLKYPIDDTYQLMFGKECPKAYLKKTVREGAIYTVPLKSRYILG
mgnify:CR=1 FL=1